MRIISNRKKRAYILSSKVGGGYLDLWDGKYIMRMHWILNVKSIFEGFEDTPNLEPLA